MRLLTRTLCTLVYLTAALAAGASLAQTGAAPAAVTVAPTNKSLLYVGRWDRSDPAQSHGDWIGSYVRAKFTGTSVGIRLGGHSGLAVVIDSSPTQVVVGGPGVVTLNPAPLTSGMHTLLVGVKGGGGWDFRGLILDPGAVIRPPVKRPLIESIGDSITCGSPGQIEAAGNYTWLTAEALGCDHTQISWPGRALTTGYGCQNDQAGLDRQYFRRGCFYDSGPDVPWDFSLYTPQIVVINLGQNDACGNEPDDIFTASYVRFLKNVRAKFPQAQIVALRMFGGGHYGTDTQKAVAALNAGGDTHIHFIDTAGWLDPADFADGVHPNASGNLKVARHLAPLLSPLLIGKSAPPAPVGDPAHPAGLAQAIQNAYVRGERRIVITPGTYLLSNQGPGDAQITLDHWRDAVLRAYHVTIIVNNQASNRRLFLLDHCINTTLEGPLLSQTRQTAYQGRITAIGKDEQGLPTCDWRPSAGYPVPPADAKELWINVVDAKTRTLNIQAGDYYHAALETLGGGAYRFHLENRPVWLHTGDWIVARYGDPPNKVFLSSCRNCTLRDITLMRNGFAPIFDGEGAGNHVLRCHWALGPRPDGATEDPVVTNAADGIHSPDADPGPDIEDCTFDGVFLDDCIAIHGGYHKILRVDGQTLVAQNAYAFYTVGEPVRISNDHGFYLQANVTALKDNGDGTSTLTLDTTRTVPTDASLSNPLHDGRGYKILRCRLGNTRSRGIIVKSDDGLIQDNLISHCGLAIRIGPEWPSEADYSRNVVVSGNTLIHNGDGIIVDGSGVKQNRDITIRDNRLMANTGQDISVAWADGVTIGGNTFAAPPAWPTGVRPKPPISVRDSQNVHLSGNTVKTPDSYPHPFIHLGENVGQIAQDDPAAGG